MRALLRKVLFMKGASWQHPLIRLSLVTLDPVDKVVRSIRGLSYLPDYSVRVRSNGISRQFGGKKFAREGEAILRTLRQYSNLRESNRVLEIGCGCGRTAVQLAKYLDDSSYTGMDIERVSLEACRTNQRLLEKHFRFDYMDIHNSVYNPNGRHRASDYRFPYADASMDVVFLISVFTHMLPEDVTNYIREIGRMLDQGGTCLFSTFLIDHGPGTKEITFKHEGDGFFYYNSLMPEIAVAYPQSYFTRTFENAGMGLAKILLGNWRGAGQASETGLAQDILVFRKVHQSQ